MAPWISEAGTSNELRTRHPLSVRIGSVPPFNATVDKGNWNNRDT